MKKKKTVEKEEYFTFLDEAYRVDFLDSWDEVISYASALYLAREWGERH